jgi:hypothetical protein
MAKHLKLDIQMSYGPSDYAALAKDILSDPALNGKTAIVCCIHDYLPALAVKPEPARWQGSVYVRVWIIAYEDRRAVLADLPQKLLPGDSTK